MITQSRVKELFSYCPESGLFTRLVTINKKAKKGDIAGHKNGHGYLHASVDGKLYKIHRLAFLYMTGSFPDACVDHIDGDRVNNSWSNLRVVTVGENNKNRGIGSNNTTGFNGVYWDKTHKKWQALIQASDRLKHLGYLDNIEDAVACREKANKVYGYHKNHGARYA